VWAKYKQSHMGSFLWTEDGGWRAIVYRLSSSVRLRLRLTIAPPMLYWFATLTRGSS